jgi:hypothetical protein
MKNERCGNRETKVETIVFPDMKKSWSRIRKGENNIEQSLSIER